MQPEREDSTTQRIRIRLRESVAKHGEVFAKFFDPVIHILEVLPEQPRRPAGRKLRVLVVEDDLPLLRAYMRILSAQDDIEIIACDRFYDALDAIRNYDAIDGVILDILLPDGSGIDVAAHLLDRWPSINGVVISAVMSPAIKGKILSMVHPEYQRCWSFHAKPDDEILAAILKVVGGTSTR
jgi:CheY-like chemotaxis protein